jgi:hypothetical protein
MRFAIFFEDAKGEHRNITADLEPAEIDYVEKVRANGGRDPGSGIPTDPDVVAMAMALKRAYARLPRGFQHTAPPELLRTH